MSHGFGRRPCDWPYRGLCLVLFISPFLAPGFVQAQGATGKAWSLSDEPTLHLEASGSGPSLFLHVSGVIRLHDGRIVVADGATSELRIFDPRGRHSETFGRDGAGPGEFRRLGWVGRVGDTLLIYDDGLRRITRVAFTPKAHLVDITRVTAVSTRGRYSVVGHLSTGEWLVTTGVSPSFSGPPGVHRLSQSFGILPRAADDSVRWVRELPSAAVFVYNPNGKIEEASVVFVGFGPWAAGQAAGGVVWLGESSSDTLIMLSPPYLASRSVHLSTRRTRLTASLVQKALEAELATARTDRAAATTRARFSPPQLPEYLPTFGRLIAAPESELWVETWSTTSQEPVRYWILGQNGAIRGHLEGPPGFRIHEAGRDYVLGIYRDTDDVEHVRLYTLFRH